LYVISAHDEAAGKEYLNKLHDYLSQEVVDEHGPFMTSLAETLSKHRSLLPWKTSIMASSSSQLFSGLRNASFTHSTKPPNIGFVFTGQGAQWHAMARSLLSFREFRESLDISNEVLESLVAGWSVVEELCKDETSTRVNEAIMSQPLCTIIQIALVDLLRSWNITPTAVVGHSSGEIAAAYAAGSLSHKGAVTTAYYRGLVVGTKKEQGILITGAMAAVRVTQSEVLALLDQLQTGTAQIACHNSPRSFTVSGDEIAIHELLDLCSSKDIWARKLLVDVAYHSSKMRSISEEYLTALTATSLGSDFSHPPGCEQFSSVNGHKMQSNVISPEYWEENLISPVLFSDALLEMCTKSKGRTLTRARNINSIDLLIEIGPHGALAAPVREIIQSQPALTKITYISALNRQEDAVESVLKVASRLFERGYSVDISAINQPTNQERSKILINLPTYPWNHSTKYWAEPRVHIDYRLRKAPRHDLLGATVKFSNTCEPRWRNWLRLSELPWLRDHRVQSLVSTPFTLFFLLSIRYYVFFEE
jgi:acyl transferase domain-containing protein